MWMLFNKATTMRDLDRRMPRTEVRNSRVMTAFCFASSQMTSLISLVNVWVRLKHAYLILRELGLPPSTDDGQVVGLAEHFDDANTGVEVYMQ